MPPPEYNRAGTSTPWRMLLAVLVGAASDSAAQPSLVLPSPPRRAVSTMPATAGIPVLPSAAHQLRPGPAFLPIGLHSTQAPCAHRPSEDEARLLRRKARITSSRTTCSGPCPSAPTTPPSAASALQAYR
eukprot:6201958-Pleurochrysis_carterae.AAC.1